MLLFERTFLQRSENRKKVLKYLYPIEIYNVLKFESPEILLLEIPETPIF